MDHPVQDQVSKTLILISIPQKIFYFILNKNMYFHQEDFFLYGPPCTRSSKQDPNHLKYVWNASFKT